MDIFEHLAQLVMREGFILHGSPNKPSAMHVSKLVPVLKKRFGVPRLPNNTETIAVSTNAPKTAALLFDRIWSPPPDLLHDPPPAKLTVYGATPLEIYTLAAIFFNNAQKFGTASEQILTEADAIFRAAMANPDFTPDRSIADSLFHHKKISAVPVLTTTSEARDQYKPGLIAALVTAIAEIAVVDEKSLKWRQVIEFRNDKQARANYHRLIHWLDSEMVGKSREFIRDEIAVRLDRYESSLRKHGIQTLIGTIESIADPAFITSAAALLGVSTWAGVQAAGALTIVSLGVGRAACTAAKSLLDLNEARRGPGSEIALIHELKRI